MSEEYPRGGWDKDLLTLKSSKVKNFKQNHTYVTEYKDRHLVIKEFEADTVLERRRFLFRSLTHFEMYKRLGDIIPRLYKAYFLKRGGRQYGIHIMQRAPGIPLEDFLIDQTSPKVLLDLAMHLKDIFKALKRAKIWHGDMHAGNWIVDSTYTGSIRSLSLIDFDSSVVDAAGLGDGNVLSFLVDIVREDDSTYLPLLPYLRKAGVGIPADIMEWDENDFEKGYLQLMTLSNEIVRRMSTDPPIKLETIHA
jgi:tRNA A-37 threonylcarbamoyl transferase component Bud32